MLLEQGYTLGISTWVKFYRVSMLHTERDKIGSRYLHTMVLI
jgi:hypothetical protein